MIDNSERHWRPGWPAVRMVVLVVLAGIAWGLLGRGWIAAVVLGAVLGLFRLLPGLRRLRRR